MAFIRAGLRADKYLKAYAGGFIALQFAGVVPDQTTTFEDGTSVTRDVVRARLIALSDDGSKGNYEGELLVHQTVLAAELKSTPGAWHIGVLSETPHATDPERTVFTLTPPEVNPREAFENAESTITGLGLV